MTVKGLGLDPDEVGRAAVDLERSAANIEKLISTIESLVRVAVQHWEGPESQHFHQAWTSQHRPKLKLASTGLHNGAGNLRNQVAEQIRASGAGSLGAGAAAPHWVDPTNPEVTLMSGQHTFVDGRRTEIQPAPGSTESTEQNTVDGDYSVVANKDGITAGAAVVGTVIAAHSVNNFDGPGGSTGELGYDNRIGADAGVKANVGPKGGSVDAQLMAGVSVGAHGQIGNDDVRVHGEAEAVGGIGLEGHANANYDHGHVKVGVKIGAALGIGAKGGMNVDVNVGGPIHAAQSAAHSVRRFFGGH